jgi:ATP-dependent DNA ligase
MRASGPSREFAEKLLQHATAAAEVTRDRNQKAESAEKEGRKKFWVHEIKHDGFRLMVRPAALSTR